MFTGFSWAVGPKTIKKFVYVDSPVVIVLAITIDIYILTRTIIVCTTVVLVVHACGGTWGAMWVNENVVSSAATNDFVIEEHRVGKIARRGVGLERVKTDDVFKGILATTQGCCGLGRDLVLAQNN